MQFEVELFVFAWKIGASEVDLIAAFFMVEVKQDYGFPEFFIFFQHLIFTCKAAAK